MSIFHDETYGKIALKKLAPVPEHFELFQVSRLGNYPHFSDTLEVKGAVFRAAKSGPRKGEFVVMVKDTVRTVYVTDLEIQLFNRHQRNEKTPILHAT